MTDKNRVPDSAITTTPDLGDKDVYLNPNNLDSVTVPENQVTIEVTVPAEFTEVKIDGDNLQIVSISVVPVDSNTPEPVVCFI